MNIENSPDGALYTSHWERWHPGAVEKVHDQITKKGVMLKRVFELGHALLSLKSLYSSPVARHRDLHPLPILPSTSGALPGSINNFLF